MEQTQEVQVLSLEKVIETKLVQNNVTNQVINALKEKYSGLQLRSLDDKESYLEIKQAAKDCAKVRNLAVKVCKEGRERAVKEQKLWVSKEKEVVGQVLEIESPLDAEIDKFDNEVKRKEDEERQRKEDAYIARQQALTTMGAKYEAGSFILGDASFEAILIKESSQDVWEEAVLPKFRVEYEKLQAEKIEQERVRAEQEAERIRQQQEFEQQQAEFRRKQEEFAAQQQAAEREAREKQLAIEAEERRRVYDLVTARASVLRGLGMSYDGTKFDFADIFINRHKLEELSETDWTALVASTTVAIKEWKDAEAKRQEEKRMADIETAKQEAIRAEQARIAEEQRQAELKRQREEAERAAQLAQATDKVKYNTLIDQFKAIHIPEMRSGQYRGKVAVISEKLKEILSL